MKLTPYFSLLKQAAKEWSEDKAPRLGAALAFYSALSLGPLLLIVVAVAALAFGEDAAHGQLLAQMKSVFGEQGASVVKGILENGARKEDQSIIATVIGIATLLFGASGVFGELQDALNTIWEVKAREGRGLLRMLKDRFLSFSMVIGTGFLLLISLSMSAGLAAMNAYFTGLLPAFAPALMVVNFVVSFAVITLLFAMMFKVLPDVKIAWKDVWVGAAMTALLFTVGKLLIGLYLGYGAVGSAYGAAGSLIAMLVWVYYSAQILYFGAEFTQVYANRFGSHLQPARGAEPLTEEARNQQGMPRTRETKGAAAKPGI